MWRVWTEGRERAMFEGLLRKRLSQQSAANALDVLGFHAERVDVERRKEQLDRALHSLRKSGKVVAEVEPMEVAGVQGGQGAAKRTLRDVLSADGAAGDRCRSMGRNKRVREGIASWDLQWLGGPGVVCFERSKRRRDAAADGARDEQVRKSVRLSVLQTAVHNPADHHIVLEPGAEPRWLSVQEEARAFEMPPASPLYHVLCETDTVTAAQAVSLFGNAVHMGAMGEVLGELVSEGEVPDNPSYGAAFCGMDTVAATLHAATGGRMRYEFASERDRVARKVLLAAWGEQGLAEERCYYDARSGPAVHEATVDVWSNTAECVKHSRLSGASDAERAAAFGEIDSSMDYVRLRGPRVVLVENVCDRLLGERMDAMLRRIGGYRWRYVVVNPSSDLGGAMDRERAYWVGTRR
jgi:hypothetical protein